jgi:hypothetical protein
VVNPGCRFKMSAIESTLATTGFGMFPWTNARTCGLSKEELDISNPGARELDQVNFSPIHTLYEVSMALDA